MKRLFVLSLFAVSGGACEREPECDTIPPPETGLTCEEIEICCQGPECWYETQDGTRFDCAGNGSCSHAAIQVVCATCEVGEETANEVGC